MPPRNCSRLVSALTTLTRTRVTAWLRRWWFYAQLWHGMNRWVATTILSSVDAFVLWVPTWRRCTRFYGRASITAASSDPNVKVAVLPPSSTVKFELADNGMAFTPQSDPVILTISRITLFRTNAVNQDFFTKHVNLRKGATMFPATALPRRTRWKKRRRIRAPTLPEPMSFDEYKSLRGGIYADKTAEMTGVPKDQLNSWHSLRRSE